jgi:ArsR family transcriptional regulator, arsenate/arsenite/antimonite-responsive transcriptional repressor
LQRLGASSLDQRSRPCCALPGWPPESTLPNYHTVFVGGLTTFHHFYYIRNMETTTVIGALSALAHESRLGIFRLLVEQGPEGLPAGEIASRRRLANANASFHLKELAQAGLVKPIRAGRFIYYAANYKTMNGLVDYLTKNCCQGGVCDIACAPVIKRKRK